MSNEQEMDGGESEILWPIAVIPLNEGNHENMGLLENFAHTSNSQMIYACNEYGEKVAVGLFITENFNAHNAETKEDYKVEESSLSNEVNLYGQWVAAQEECVTDSSEPVKEDMMLAKSTTEVVWVYKVNKGKKKSEPKKKITLNRLKTLKEIKSKVKVNAQSEQIASSKSKSKTCTKVEEFSSHCPVVAKVRRGHKRNQDKAYPVPNSIRHVKFHSEFV